ncbi:hypothetical protein AAG570_006041 [Ranatra chinensis]|uniref:Activator of basal transcription 1 n=1 Tax=Ranatra chinensis TaxID=642074 RepID=A0ABD0XWW1_9HEMI
MDGSESDANSAADSSQPPTTGEAGEVAQENAPGSSLLPKKKKVYKKGIIYLSSIPQFMTITKLTQLMSQYGKVGRVFLQPPQDKDVGRRKKKVWKRLYTEGWVEFMKKRVAKEVAINLNNQPIGGKKGKNKFHDYLWSIKYLPRFKWIHLSERLSYERAVFKHRMQTEIRQAKRIASKFLENVELAERLEKKKKKKKEGNDEEAEEKQTSDGETNDTTKPVFKNVFKQRETDSQKLAKSKIQKTKQSREEFLKSIFS